MVPIHPSLPCMAQSPLFSVHFHLQFSYGLSFPLRVVRKNRRTFIPLACSTAAFTIPVLGSCIATFLFSSVREGRVAIRNEAKERVKEWRQVVVFGRKRTRRSGWRSVVTIIARCVGVFGVCEGVEAGDGGLAMAVVVL